MSESQEEPVDIIELLRGEMLEELDRELKQVFEDMMPKPGWKGFTGIMSVLDESAVKIVPAVPPSWTPKEFEDMWNRRSYVQKVVFVLDLIS